MYVYMYICIYIYIYIYIYIPALCLGGGRCADDESKVEACVSIRQHTSAYVRTSAYVSMRHIYQRYAFEDADGADDESKVGGNAERKLERDLTMVAFVSIRTVAYVSIHTVAYAHLE